MVLSMLPMNVFGAPRGTVTGNFSGYGASRTFTVNIDGSDFRGRATSPTSLFIEFQLTGGASFHTTGGGTIDTNVDAGYIGYADGGWVQQAGPDQDEFLEWLNNGSTTTNYTRWSGTRITVELPDIDEATMDEFSEAHTDTGRRVIDDDIVGLFSTTVRVNTTDEYARLQVRLMSVDERGNITPLVVLADRNLVEHAAAGVTITADAPVPLVGAARVPNITITENQPGALAPVNQPGVSFRHAIRLLAPRGFVWVDGRDVDVLGGGAFQLHNPGGGTGVLASVTNNAQLPLTSPPDPDDAVAAYPFIHVPPVNGRDAIVLDVSFTRNVSPLVQAVNASFDIRNLWLVATDAAQTEGIGYIAVEFGQFVEWDTRFVGDYGYRIQRTGWHHIGTGWNANSAYDNNNVAPIPGPYRTNDDMTRIGVATNVQAPETAVDGINTVLVTVGVSGQRTFEMDLRGNQADFHVPTATRNPNFPVNASSANLRAQYAWSNNPQFGGSNRANSNWRELALPVAILGEVGAITVSEYEDRTELVSGNWQEGFSNGIIRMTESVPSSMLRGVETYTFRLRQEGVSFVDAQWRATGIAGNAWHRRSGNFAGSTVDGWRTANDSSVADPANRNQANHLPGTTFGDRSVTLMPRPQDAISGLRNLDFQFVLSVEAGFAQRYDEIEVEVLIFPHGIREVVTLAIVEDPITVRSGEPARIWRPTAAGFDFIPPTAVPSITIEENDYGVLEVGDLVWLRVVSTFSDTGHPANLPLGEAILRTGITPVVDSESGLTLRHIGWGETIEEIEMGTGVANIPGSGINAHVFVVDTPSYGTPATITFTNNFVEGMFPSGVDVQLVVGGTRLSRNGVDATRATIPRSMVELENNAPAELPSPAFDGMPYATPVLEVRTAVDEVEPPEGWGPVDPVDPVDPPRVFTPLVLQAGMNRVFSQSQNAWVEYPVTTQGGVKRVALRVFGDHIGADIMIMTADRVVIISGLAVNGERMTVHLPVSSNLATIIYNDRGVTLENIDIANWVNQNSPTGASSGPFGSVQTILYRNLTYLPARFLAYVFGFDVDWAAGVTTITPRS
jgi:hypothetical protein